MSKTSKYGNPARRALAGDTRTPHDKLEDMTRKTARTVLEELKAVQEFGNLHPHTQGLQETRLNFEVAALALIEALDHQNGRTPAREEQ